MKSEYLDIFEQRGSAYDQAMQYYPSARNNEFLHLFDHIHVNTIRKILDVPSGGGYLGRYLPDTAEVHCLEPCQEFNPENPHLTDNIDLDDLLIPPATFDCIVCLAAIHHVKNKHHFIERCYNGLQVGGFLIVADVEQGSGISSFLDDFAGQHNGTGHNGMYLSQHSMVDIASGLGLDTLSSELLPCPWVFEGEASMLTFCRLLFGLKSVSDEQLKQALHDYVGFSIINSKLHLHWQLLYATMKKLG